MDPNSTQNTNDHNLPDLSTVKKSPQVTQKLSSEDIHTPGNNPDINQLPSMNTSILNTDDTRNRYKKIALGVFGILLLVGGVATGVLLVQQEQDIRQKAASCSQEGDSCEQTTCCEGYVCQGTSGSRVCRGRQEEGTCTTNGGVCGGNQGYVGYKCDQLINGQCIVNPQTFDSFGEAAAYAGSCGQVEEVWAGGPCNKNLCGEYIVFDSGCTKEPTSN